MAHRLPASAMKLAMRDSPVDQVKSQWQGPGNIMDVLLLIGADVIQAALAQVAGSQLPTPVTFSFGWLTYTFTALVSVFGDSRLFPDPDVECLVVNTRSQYIRENGSWTLGRLLRDFEYGYWMDPDIRRQISATNSRFCIAVYEPFPGVRAGKMIPGLSFYAGYVVAVVQLCISAIPWILYRGSNYMVFVITASGTILSIGMSSIPAWRQERFAFRTKSKNTTILTRGNGASYALVIEGTGYGPNFEDIASGAKLGPRVEDLLSAGGAKWRLQLTVAAFTILWVALLITVDGLQSNTWYLIAIGAIGSCHALFLSRMRLRPEQVGLPLRYVASFVAPKMMDTLMQAEEAKPGVGLALLPILFPGALRESEIVFWDEKRRIFESHTLGRVRVVEK